MKQYNGLPIYEVEFSDEVSVFNNVSFVTRPAIEEGFIRLSKQDRHEIRLKINEESRIVSGPVLIPGQPIYRVGESGREFYITWSKDTIKQVAINFFQHNRQNEGNVEHEFSINGVTFFESYIINKERGLVPKEFEDLPTGTWILSAKVNDDATWQLIKDGTLTGFSIDMSNLAFKEEKEIDSLDDLMEYLINA